MAQKVISTYYKGEIRQDETNNYLIVNFATKGKLKQWLSKFTASYASPTHIVIQLYKVEIKWDDSTKYISSLTTNLTAEDL